MLSLGQALAAGLLAKQVPVWLDTPMTGPHIEDGRASGVALLRDGQPAVMRHSYAGAGATIGPAMTFGYIAALDIANRGRG